MIATSSAAIAAAERLKAQAGARVHRLCEPDELQEEAMPRRKIATTEPAAPTTGPKKRGRKPRSEISHGPRFGVFDEGSVTLNLPHCKGQMIPQEAREFVGFLAKIGVKA